MGRVAGEFGESVVDFDDGPGAIGDEALKEMETGASSGTAGDVGGVAGTYMYGNLLVYRLRG